MRYFLLQNFQNRNINFHYRESLLAVKSEVWGPCVSYPGKADRMAGRVVSTTRGCSTRSYDHTAQPHLTERGSDYWRFYGCGKTSSDPFRPIPLAYSSNNTSNIFLLFGGTYNVTSISSSLLIHTPSTNFGFGVETATKRQNGGRSM